MKAIVTLLAACGLLLAMTHWPAQPEAGKLRYLALGDSYTEGTRVDPAQSFPEQLAEALHQDGHKLAPPEIVARNGWTTDELLAGIEKANPKGPYHLVTLLIGVNNQFRGYALDQYKEEFRKLLNMAIAFAGGEERRVVVLSIPDYGCTPYGRTADAAQIAVAIDAFNAANQAITEGRGVAYVNITEISREKNHTDWVAKDGLHPSEAQYAAWVEALLPVVRRICN